ncbi:MAG TPA: TatD family hydrolase, partial [Bacillaceae bacterium]
MNPIIDAHIHLDLYEDKEIEILLDDLDRVQCTSLISVSFHLESCRKNLELAERDGRVKPAFGFHPEQEIPSERDLDELFSWMETHKDSMVAVGEVGLPYYMRQGHGAGFRLGGYIELLEEFCKRASRWDIPISLHAVYDDAPVVCVLLEKNNIKDAHFHWFKGDRSVTERMIENGYMISVTPDVLYEQEIRQLVELYPLGQIMVETDGPWRFEGMFSGRMTHPEMIHHSIEA